MSLLLFNMRTGELYGVGVFENLAEAAKEDSMMKKFKYRVSYFLLGSGLQPRRFRNSEGISVDPPSNLDRGCGQWAADMSTTKSPTGFSDDFRGVC